jgi:recombinational DNA repair protein RecT
VGPGGLITLAHRAGFVATATCVFEADTFDYELGTGRFLRHKKATSSRRPEPPKSKKDDEVRAYNMEIERRVVAAYAVIHSLDKPNAPPIISVQTAEDIAFYRRFSKAGFGPWFDNFEGMARKTALKRAMADVPKSYVLMIALGEDDHGAFVPPPRMDDPSPSDEPKRELVEGKTDSSGFAEADRREAAAIDRGQDQGQRLREPVED